MNAVEIEEAISALAEQPFDAQEFPFAFLEAFGNKSTTIKRLRSGALNKSDLGGVLQTSNIHLAVCSPGEVTKTLTALKASPATARAKAKFTLATDGTDFEAEDLTTGETVACAFRDFPDHFGFFLPLAGITTVKQVRESSFDIRATSRLNRLYVELLKNNAEWGTTKRRHDMNHFMARLIFCFFAENTDIFNGTGLFTATIEQMSAKDSSNTHEVIGELFRAMNTRIEDRTSAKIARWADAFPYVNGGLFSGSTDVPRFSRIARSYLLHIGKLDWAENIKAGFLKEKDVFREQGIAYVAPLVSLAEPPLVPKQLFQALKDAIPGLTLGETRNAVAAGYAALDAFNATMRRKAREILESCARNDRPCILILARPYHMDPGIGHEIEADLQAYGYPILWLQYLPIDPDLLDWLFGEDIRNGLAKSPFDIRDVWPSSYSGNTNEILWGAKVGARLPWVSCVIRLTSYECGMDQPTFTPVQQIVEHSGTLFFSFQDLDSTKPAGSVKIRVETIAYYLQRSSATIIKSKKEQMPSRCPLLPAVGGP